MQFLLVPFRLYEFAFKRLGTTDFTDSTDSSCASFADEGSLRVLGALVVLFL